MTFLRTSLLLVLTVLGARRALAFTPAMKNMEHQLNRIATKSETSISNNDNISNQSNINGIHIEDTSTDWINTHKEELLDVWKEEKTILEKLKDEVSLHLIEEECVLGGVIEEDQIELQDEYVRLCAQAKEIAQKIKEEDGRQLVH